MEPVRSRPPSQNDPAGHTSHSSALVALVLGVYEPGGQSCWSGNCVPMGQKCPAAHGSGGRLGPPVPRGHALPAGHRQQSDVVVPLVMLYHVPAGQGYCRWLALPCGHTKPSMQLALGADRPVAVHALPASHGRHSFTSPSPVDGLYLPVGQGMPLLWLPVGHAYPTGHGLLVHAVSAVLPVADEKVPAGHGYVYSLVVPARQ
jgi:hypothetical protein